MSEELKVGDQVTCVVEWHGGRTTQSEGVLVAVAGDKAYVRTTVGCVEVALESVELVLQGSDDE